MTFLVRQSPFWSFKKSRLIKISDLFSAKGLQFVRKEAVAAALLARLRPGLGSLRGVPGAVRQGRGAERRLPSDGPIGASSPRFFGVVAHQVVIGRRFIIATVVVVVVFMGYFVDSIALLE